MSARIGLEVREGILEPRSAASYMLHLSRNKLFNLHFSTFIYKMRMYRFHWLV